MSGIGVDRDLEVRLDTIRREHGETVRVDQVGEVVRSLLDSIGGDISAGDLRLYREVESLSHYIHAAREEIAALRPGDIKNQFIASATDELDAIVGATEAANWLPVSILRRAKNWPRSSPGFTRPVPFRTSPASASPKW